MRTKKHRAYIPGVGVFVCYYFVFRTAAAMIINSPVHILKKIIPIIVIIDIMAGCFLSFMRGPPVVL